MIWASLRATVHCGFCDTRLSYMSALGALFPVGEWGVAAVRVRDVWLCSQPNCMVRFVLVHYCVCTRLSAVTHECFSFGFADKLVFCCVVDMRAWL